MNLLTAETFFVLVGAYLSAMAGHIALDRSHPRRLGSVLFWGLLAWTFVTGRDVDPLWIGYALLLMAALAGAGQVAPPAAGPKRAGGRDAGLGLRLLAPALLVPVLVVVGGMTLDRIRWGEVRLAAAAQLNTTALGVAAVTGLLAALWLTRASPKTAWHEGSRLLQVFGWALVLPQLLAALGGVFAQAGVGKVVADGVAAALPTHHPLVAVVAYCGGMALFTAIMGNAFAAFPVITLGIGLPFIVQEHGGNPAIMGALGMLSGYCGTLVTPMAANFNLVPVVLLELEDRMAVIKAQAPMAAAIWLFNVAAMYLCVYRF
ncbi:MAG: permease [Opitutia bacterium Tous-C1TDCM]|nr:MAG: permease [Opitutae bacterium Tous-C1TDCM]